MYRRVLDDPLEFPPHFDTVTCDFLAGVSDHTHFFFTTPPSLTHKRHIYIHIYYTEYNHAI